MDRNLILALAGSFLVLSLYQAVFVLPKRTEDLKKMQASQTNTVTTNSVNSAISTPSTIKKSEEPTTASIKEKITDIKTPMLDVKFSNVGGTLHKITIGKGDKVLPVENLLTMKGFENRSFVLTSQDDKNVNYAYSDTQWKIIKQYRMLDNSSIGVHIEITNIGNVSRVEDFQFRAMQLDNKYLNDGQNHNTMLYELAHSNNKKIHRRGEAHKFNDKDDKSIAGNIDWVAFRGHYHTIIVKPEFETKAFETESLGENELNASVRSKEQEIAPGATVSYDFTVVAGNQDIKWLKGYNKGIETVVAFSGWWIIDIFAKGVYYTIPFLHMICNSWGFSIILISLLIYGITYPLTMKSMTSMRKMQLLQPKIAALQKKHKDDPKALNAEMVGIYKREGVNPLGGCLPFILQMPVFMALYQILWRAYYFQGKSFLWIQDLALPDRLIILPFSLPLMGNEFNILPILMGGVMFLQQHVSSKNMVVTDDTQKMQQKMMKYFFPIFITCIFYHFASGLSLYFTVFYALSTWTQWKVAQDTNKVEAAKVR